MKKIFFEQMLEILVCPDCRQKLRRIENALNCPSCRLEFPIINNIPVVLSENSVFSVEQITGSTKTYYAEEANQIKNNSIKRRFRKSLPKITKSWERGNFYQVIKRESKDFVNPKGLQLGAGEIPTAINSKIEGVDWTHSDVDLAFKPDLIADATGLPFPSESFDIVYADSVLEHVFDLAQGVSEIQRVTKVGGLIAIGIPFLYPFHGVPYDFTRLTPCGLRAAFKQTENLFLSRDSGAFVALALQLDSRMINLFKNRKIRGGTALVSRFLFSGFKHLDRVYHTSRHLTTATGLLYVGRKTKDAFSSKVIMSELQNLYGTLE